MQISGGRGELQPTEQEILISPTYLPITSLQLNPVPLEVGIRDTQGNSKLFLGFFGGSKCPLGHGRGRVGPEL